MSEAEAYAAKESAKAALLEALTIFLAAAEEYDLDDSEQAAELEEICTDAGKQWEVIPA